MVSKGELPCELGWGASVLISFCPQRFCKFCQARGNQGVGLTLHYPVLQPATLWPGQEALEAEATDSGLTYLLDSHLHKQSLGEGGPCNEQDPEAVLARGVPCGALDKLQGAIKYSCQ